MVIQNSVQRVLIWSFKSRVGGGGLCGLELARAFSKQENISVSVCCLAGSQLESLSVNLGLKTYGLPPGFRELRKVFPKFIRDQKPTLVINPMLSLRQTPLLPVILNSRARYVMLIHEARARRGNSTIADHFGLMAQRWESKQADLCVALSKHTANQIITNVPVERVATAIHPAFNAARQKEVTAVPSNPARILFFGRGNKSKGIDRLLEAVALLRDRLFVELELCVDPELAKQIGEVRGVRCFTDNLSEQALEEKILDADVVALPYENASQSGVAARAMGVGCPCVATPVGGLPEQVVNSQTGHIAIDMSVSAFADALERTLSDPVHYAQLVKQNLELARTARSWSEFARLILHTLN